MDKTYWIVRYKHTGHVSAGWGKRVSPALYTSRGRAIAARKGYMQTDEDFLSKHDVIAVKLVELDPNAEEHF